MTRTYALSRARMYAYTLDQRTGRDVNAPGRHSTHMVRAPR